MMESKTLVELKDGIKRNMDNLMACRESSSSTLPFSGEKDCSEAVEHYCKALNYLSQIKED